MDILPKVAVASMSMKSRSKTEKLPVGQKVEKKPLSSAQRAANELRNNAEQRKTTRANKEVQGLLSKEGIKTIDFVSRDNTSSLGHAQPSSGKGKDQHSSVLKQ